MSAAEQHDVIFDLEIDASKSIGTLQQVERLVYRVLGLFRRFGLPEEIDAAITKIQRMVLSIRMLHAAMIALHAASGPVGWALAIVGGVSAAWTAYDVAWETARASREW